MAIAYIQSAYSEADNNSSTIATAYGSNVAAGSLLVAVVAAEETVASIADTLGNTWQFACSILNTPDSQWGEIWYAMNSGAGANTVTVTFSVSSQFRRLAVSEYSGAALSAALDKVATAIGTGTALDSGSQTTTTNGQLIVGGFQAFAVTFTPGGSFTVRQLGASQQAILADFVQSSAGSVSANGTAGGSTDWAALMATFKAPAGGGAQVTWMPGASVSGGVRPIAVPSGMGPPMKT
jgi:hypothetical protein